MIYAILGWIMEVTCKLIQYKRFINRGFLIGPYCPIYGSGAVVVTVLVGGLIGNASYIVTFLASFVLCGVLEYFVSWYMEKMFHARWWDYSQKPMNLHAQLPCRSARYIYIKLQNQSSRSVNHCHSWCAPNEVMLHYKSNARTAYLQSQWRCRPWFHILRLASAYQSKALSSYWICKLTLSTRVASMVTR